MSRKSQLAKLGLFTAKVPRYTSYPTVQHFTPNVDATLYSSWLKAISPGSQISLYVHIPFCRKLCWFCACRTQGTQSNEPIEAYLEVLKSEISLVASQLPEGLEISRLHWGGGTPTILSAAQIRDLAQRFADHLPLSPTTEFSVEVDPGEIDQERCNALLEVGMTRASVGMQDFNDRIQQVIGRRQSFEQTYEAARLLRAAGLQKLNAEILCGLPYQTPPSITETTQLLLSLTPDRVAVSDYIHQPSMARRQSMIPTDSLPTPEEKFDLFETAAALLCWDGYEAIGIDHFARSDDTLTLARNAGQLRRGFQGYSADPSEVLIGLGASAVSRFPQGYAQNEASTAKYSAAIKKGRFASRAGHAFCGEDALRARLIEMLLCRFEISRSEALDEFPGCQAILDPLLDQAYRSFPGAMDLSNTRLSLTEEARPLVRVIAQQIFDSFAQVQSAHSDAPRA